MEGSEPVREEVIPVLRVADAARSVAWYARLQFRKEWEHRFKPGFPAFVSIARGRVHLYLSEHTGDARPDTLIHLNVATSIRSRQSSANAWTRRAMPAAR